MAQVNLLLAIVRVPSLVTTVFLNQAKFVIPAFLVRQGAMQRVQTPVKALMYPWSIHPYAATENLNWEKRAT
jgi:hypothetical protein